MEKLGKCDETLLVKCDEALVMATRTTATMTMMAMMTILTRRRRRGQQRDDDVDETTEIEHDGDRARRRSCLGKSDLSRDGKEASVSLP
jgi:hypothetical protein